MNRHSDLPNVLGLTWLRYTLDGVDKIRTTDNVRTSVILRRVRLKIVAAEKLQVLHIQSVSAALIIQHAMRIAQY